jgi:hypothetical protein
MGEHVQSFATAYDVAFFDTSPVLAVTDVAILGRASTASSSS